MNWLTYFGSITVIKKSRWECSSLWASGRVTHWKVFQAEQEVCIGFMQQFSAPLLKLLLCSTRQLVLYYWWNSITIQGKVRLFNVYSSYTYASLSQCISWHSWTPCSVTAHFLVYAMKVMAETTDMGSSYVALNCLKDWLHSKHWLPYTACSYDWKLCNDQIIFFDKTVS